MRILYFITANTGVGGFSYSGHRNNGSFSCLWCCKARKVVSIFKYKILIKYFIFRLQGFIHIMTERDLYVTKQYLYAKSISAFSTFHISFPTTNQSIQTVYSYLFTTNTGMDGAIIATKVALIISFWSSIFSCLWFLPGRHRHF